MVFGSMTTGAHKNVNKEKHQKSDERIDRLIHIFFFRNYIKIGGRHIREF